MFNPIQEEITFAIQSPEVMKIISEITDIKMIQGEESLLCNSKLGLRRWGNLELWKPIICRGIV